MAGRKPNKRSNHRPYPSSMASQSSTFKFKRSSLIILLLLFSCVIMVWSVSSNRWYNGPAQIYTIEVVSEFPHDPKAFTQGLLYGGNDTLFESTGLYRESSVRKVVLHTGKVVVLQKMDDSYFGEGLTLLGERLFQLTWLTKTGFIYDQNNLSKFEKFTHGMNDGWGLATNGQVLFGSDGSSTLYQIDPQTLKVTGKQIVKYKGLEVHNLNELEFINGEVWANVWMTDCIARISHKDGVVLGWILLHNLREGLLASGHRGIDVLNGIAWDSDKGRLFVTGKLWPKLYEIKLQQMKKQSHGAIEQLCLRTPYNFANP